MKSCTSCSRPLLPIAEACPFCGVRLSKKWVTAAGAAVVAPFLLSACYGGPMILEDCFEIDFDGDGWSGDSNCFEVLDCDDTQALINPAEDEVCDDGVDNNCDGISAGVDQVEVCGNGLDDDCDGQIDEPRDISEGGIEGDCTDGQDNDCDGLIDMVDPDCTGDDPDTDVDGVGDLVISYVFDGPPGATDCATAGLSTLSVDATGSESVSPFAVACDDSDVELLELATGAWSVQVTGTSSNAGEHYRGRVDEVDLTTQGAAATLTLTCTAADGVSPCASAESDP